MKNEEFVEGLRRVADWYEKHPDFPQPYTYNRDTGVFTDYVHTKDAVLNAKKVFGSASVETDNSYLRVFKSFGVIQLCICSARSNICTKRVVRTEMVKERVAIEWEDQDVEKEIVEWDCPPELNIEGDKNA